MTNKLDGKVAIVTGAFVGIGEATAIALAAEGPKMAIAEQHKLTTLLARIYLSLYRIAKRLTTA